MQETQEATVNPILTGLGIDQRYARNESGNRTYFLTDALGSTRALTNASGDVVQRYDYTPYGQTSQLNAGTTNPYQYTGREKDASGLYYYRARYYSTSMARFIAEDAIGLAGGENMYAYVGGDPASFTDPTGEVAFLAVLGLLGKAALGAGFEIGAQALGNYLNDCDLLDYQNYDWWDVGISAGVGVFAPGALTVAKRGWRARKAIGVLSDQLAAARTQNRIKKISSRIGDHKSEFGELAAIQGMYQGMKASAKAAFGPGNGCGCSQ